MRGYLGLLLVGGAAVSCRAPAPPQEPPFLRGRIVVVDSGVEGLRIWVEGTPGAGHHEDKAYLTVVPATALLRRGGGRAEPAELARGRAVSVWIGDEPRIETYPIQAAARVIVLESDSTSTPPSAGGRT